MSLNYIPMIYTRKNWTRSSIKMHKIMIKRKWIKLWYLLIYLEKYGTVWKLEVYEKLEVLGDLKVC